jgi:GAF domain-containing protein
LTPTDGPDHADITRAFEQLGRITLADNTMESVLQRICDLAGQLLPGDVSASVSILADDKPETAAFSGDLSRRLDENQYGRGYGPCLEAIAAGRPLEVDDARTDGRWPDYLQVAQEMGSLSSLSVPLPLHQQQWGAGLNLYARQAHAFDDTSRELAGRFADYAAVAVANMHAYEGAVAYAQNLEAALESRAVIDQAKGILMERYKLTADQAFQALARLSMQTNVKVRDVAEHVVTTGELAAPGGKVRHR